MKKITYILFILSITIGYGQRKYAADKYFKEFAYKKSSKIYKAIHDKGDNSYLTLSRLSDSYYYNNEYEEAEKYYRKLIGEYEKIAIPDHIFRYAQTLKTNEKIEESNRWLLKLKDKGYNTSAIALENNRDYFTEYSNKPQIYFNLHNLSSNTEYSDFGGFVKNGEFYFSSTRPKTGTKGKLYQWNRQPYLNIYKAKESIIEKSTRDIADITLLEDVSSKYHESNFVITKDGNTAYFTRDNYDGKKLHGDDHRISHLKLFKAEKKDNKWVNIQELPFNNDAYSCGHPTLSTDEKNLYFVSDMPGGYGNTDIYRVSISGNSYGKPENLGKTINTGGKEMFPFISENGNLFFASNGHLGLGGLDVFESKLENNTYGKPINIGTPINSTYDDFSFIINEEDKYGFFSSNRKEGKGDDDIYSFIVKPECKESIKIVVTDSITKAPLGGVDILFTGDEKSLEEQVIKEDGTYLFTDNECDKEYTFVASKKNYREATKSIKTLGVNNKEVVQNIELVPLIVEDEIVIRPIYFDFDKHNIRKDSEQELEHIVTVMNNYPDMVIKIESHTDSRGSADYNKHLSTMRAESVRDYIISRGIASNRIESAMGYGEDKLLDACENCTEEQHQKNRRSSFYIVKGRKENNSRRSN
ncbi:OmpA family protein [Aquimarina aquimarini]|uniref:OmpA family protein n=1 Tax=Aquimarina aquimarini TaxID=1191734 RepID=UPI000D561F9C|nr:OmpA family protein [Aquimarina aquimarini]